MSDAASTSDPAAAPVLRIDIVSDVVCPWCVVGWRQLEHAIARTGVRADVRWQPFELNPGMAREGENLDEHVRAKYGGTAEHGAAARERLAALGTSLGFDFRWSDDMRIRPTFDAHRLLHWAATLGGWRDCTLQAALFEAYFTAGRDVADHETLADVAAGAGLDREAARAVLAGGHFADEVRARERFWIAQGIDGVPAVVLGGRYLLVGAQGVDRYAAALERVASKAAARAATEPEPAGNA